jgi:pimeloyl-ACP methyl ester carboxylesterase/class 3 adenylate cyclase
MAILQLDETDPSCAARPCLAAGSAQTFRVRKWNLPPCPCRLANDSRPIETQRVGQDIRYTTVDGVHIAYQVVGSGGLDLVYVAEFWHSIEAQWEEPAFATFLGRLGSFARLICFDQRGTGLSDPIPLAELPGLEQWMDDVRAVMDAAGSRRAGLLGSGGGGLMSALFAATYPERTRALILLNSYARLGATTDYPVGGSSDLEGRIEHEMATAWGRGALVEMLAPSRMGDARFRDWLGRYQRLGASPGTVLAHRRMLRQLDVRDILPSIRVPTLVLHRRDNALVNAAHARYLAEHIPGARHVEVPGTDYFPFAGDQEPILDEIERFLTGSSHRRESDRFLATILLTDIVDSTRRAAELGDRRWRELLEAHNRLVRGEMETSRGRDVATTGDGFLATFDGPARAVRCALSLTDAVRSLGLEVRAGLHAGEVEPTTDGIGGLAVHIAARVSAIAGPNEVLVTSTVRDLVAGSGIRFEDRGGVALKGVPDEWRIYAVAAE